MPPEQVHRSEQEVRGRVRRVGGRRVLQHRDRHRAVREHVRGRHAGRGRVVGGAVVCQLLLAIAAVVRDEGIRFGPRHARLRHDGRARRILGPEQRDRIRVQAEPHVVDGQFDDALRVGREVGPERRVAAPEAAGFDSQQSVHRVNRPPVGQALTRLLHPACGAQQRDFHRAGAHAGRFRLDGPGEQAERLVMCAAARRVGCQIEQGGRAVGPVLLRQFPVERGRPSAAQAPGVRWRGSTPSRGRC